MFLSWPILSQAQLREFESVPVDVPNNIIQGNSRYPDNALILVYSTLPGLQFRSSMDAMNLIRYDPQDHVHLILVSPIKQILSVTAPGFIELQIQTINPAPKSVFAFKVEERKSNPLGSSGFLSVESSPPGAVIWVNNIETVYRTPSRLPVPSGQMVLGLRADRYVPFDTLLQFRRGEELVVDRPLKAAWADLSITVSPPDAQVVMEREGEIIGTAIGNRTWQGREFGLDPDVYRLRVNASGFRDDVREFRLQAGDRLNQAVALTPLQGGIQIKSAPSGALVLINGNRVGTTPYVGSGPAGTCEVVLRLEGYQEAVRTLRVQDGKSEFLDVKLEQKLTAKLEINSQPEGATVLLDGDEIGQTPLMVELDVTDKRKRGNQKVVVRLAGHDEESSTINVQPSERVIARQFTLTRQMGRYQIETRPSGAEVFADGVSLGMAPIRGELPTGFYSITAQKPRYAAEPEQIEIRKNRMTQLDLAMKKTERLPADRFYFFLGATAFALNRDTGQPLNSAVQSDDLSGGGFGIDSHMAFMSSRNIGLITGLNWTSNINGMSTDETFYDRYVLYAGPILSFPLAKTVKMEFSWTWGISAMDVHPGSSSLYSNAPVEIRLPDNMPQIQSLARENRLGINFRFGSVLPFYLGVGWHRVRHEFADLSIYRSLDVLALNAGFCIPAAWKNR